MTNINNHMENEFNRNALPFNLVGLGGTFDHLHKGHHILLQNAFKFGKKVAIALTTNALLKGKSFYDKIEPYSVRKAHLIEYIEDILKIPPEDYCIVELSDPFGPAITDENLEAHISSLETYKVSLEINRIRLENNLKPLFLIIIPMILDESGERFSSTKIRREIK